MWAAKRSKPLNLQPSRVRRWLRHFFWGWSCD
jgi:hypothetical protein